MYTISPRQGECYFLRLLLNVVKGPKSYDDLKTVNGEVCATFREACQKQGLLEDDQHLQLAMEEACATQSPKLLRDLLAIILVSCNPSQPGHLWVNFRDHLAEDFLISFRREVGDEAAQYTDTIYNQAVCAIEDQLLALAGICPWLQTDAGKAKKRPQKTYGDQKDPSGGPTTSVSGTTALSCTTDTGTDEETARLERVGALDDGHLTPPDDDKEDSDRDVVRTYKRRWLMLLLFSVYSMSNAYMWIHLNIIANIVLHYYNASLPADTLQAETAVDWLSLVYMLAYMLLIPIGMYILDSYGLRANNLTGCTLNAIGAWLKCLAVSPDRFPLLMVAQTLCGISQVFIVSLPPRLAAVWFGPNEVSTATAIGVFGNQLGVAIGFLVPPRVVNNSANLDDITEDLGNMFYTGAAICTCILILMLLWLNTGCYYAISTLLNYMVLFYHPGEEVNVGGIGLTIILTGIAGSVLAGIWLDRSKYFKSTSVMTFVMCVVGMLAFTFTLDQPNIWVVFLTAGSLGFFMTGYLPVGYEFATEITYPEPEGTSSGLLTASAMMFGIVMTLGMRAMMNQVSILAANIFVCCTLLIGTVLTALVKPRYRRQEAEKEVMDTLDNVEVDVKAPITD
ncbi:hypothetical protein ACOMHN_016231 [Nucella lapillus]